MKFNRKNYEEFALDYLEGTLDARDMEAFRAFLLINPDLHTEFEEFSLVTVEPDALQVFQHKRALIQRRRFPLYVGLLLVLLLTSVLTYVFLAEQSVEGTSKVTSESLASDQSGFHEATPLETTTDAALLESSETSNSVQIDEDVVTAAPASAADDIELMAELPAAISSAKHGSLELDKEQELTVPSPSIKTESIASRSVLEIEQEREGEQQTQRLDSRLNLRAIVPLDALPLESLNQIQYLGKERSIEIIHPELLRQFAPSDVDPAAGKLKQWLSNVSLVPNAYRKGEGKSIKDKLLPEYMVAE